MNTRQSLHLLIFFFVATLMASPAIGQNTYTVTGEVFVKGERKPIEGVAVFVVGHEEIGPAITDGNGRFSVELPGSGEYNLTAMMVGFAKPEPVKNQRSGGE